MVGSEAQPPAQLRPWMVWWQRPEIANPQLRRYVIIQAEPESSNSASTAGSHRRRAAVGGGESGPLPPVAEGEYYFK